MNATHQAGTEADKRTEDFPRTPESARGARRLVETVLESWDLAERPGVPGRVVVSTGMLHTLDALAQLGASANPLLRPFATAVTYTIERWAGENAATTTGDRTQVARTVGKAALAAHRAPALARTAGAALGILGRRGPLASAGPVPRRVAALLAPPLGRHPALATQPSSRPRCSPPPKPPTTSTSCWRALGPGSSCHGPSRGQPGIAETTP